MQGFGLTTWEDAVTKKGKAGNNVVWRPCLKVIVMGSIQE